MTFLISRTLLVTAVNIFLTKEKKIKDRLVGHQYSLNSYCLTLLALDIRKFRKGQTLREIPVLRKVAIKLIKK